MLEMRIDAYTQYIIQYVRYKSDFEQLSLVLTQLQQHEVPFVLMRSEERQLHPHSSQMYR